MSQHELKTDPAVFSAVLSGAKTPLSTKENNNESN
jgi:hypothetical protein